MKKVFLAACAALASMSLFAQTEDTPWSIGVYGNKIEAANDWGNKFFHIADGFYGGASFTVSHYLNKYFDAELQALWGRYGTKGGDFNATDPDFKAGMGYVDLSGKYKFIHSDTTRLSPYVFLSLGARAIYGLGESSDFQTTQPDNEGFNFVIGGGAGVDFRVSDKWGLRYFFKYGYPIGGTADANDNRECGKFNDQHLIHSLGVYFNIAFNKDKDGDGVPNKLDKCPNTLPEAIKFVDEKGCDKDSDGDGVFDYLDECPNTPAGIKVDEKGCPVDTDGDGVTDDIDLCPDTPEAARGFVDANGCPLDSDGDGVFDYLDQCPGTPAEAKGFVDEKGCPTDKDGDGIFDYEDVCPDQPGVKANNGCPEIKAEVKQIFEKALNGIQFETGSAKIKKSSNGILDQVVTVMKENPSWKLSINGHTDNSGKPDKNQKLSEDRAAAVKAYLVNKGIEDSRLTSAGFGQDKPVASNKTAAGKAKNRRVEFIVRFEK
ncbi:MAG: OmpA family protein [Paludibacteraceae bacterium]|nr:OmpA family protein [Paludibacteraceae bacterium]